MSLPNTVAVVPENRAACINEDPDDDRFLECATAGSVDCLVSGDEHLLALAAFEGIPIMNSRVAVGAHGEALRTGARAGTTATI